MPEVHLVVGCAVILLNLARLRRRRDRLVSRSPLDPVLVPAARRPGLGLPPGGARRPARLHRPQAPDDLHYLYGILPLLVSFLAEGARTGAAQRELGETDFESLPADTQQSLALAIVRREMGIMAVSCGVILFLALRAAGTSGHLF